MWLKKYINNLEIEKTNIMKDQAKHPYDRESFLYQLTELGIAMRGFWIEVCKSFVRRGVAKIFVLVVLAQLMGLAWCLIRGG